MRGRSRHQGGSLLGFVAIAILLAGLLVGGLYFVQRYNDEAETGPIASNTESDNEKNTTDNSTSSTEMDNDKNKNTTANNATDKTGNNTNTTANKNDDKNTSTNSSNTANSEKQASDSAVSNLPETGPTDILVQLVTLGVVTFAFASFVQSRRSLDF